MNTPKLVAYVRVSTQKQGNSGLGLAGQTTAISQYAGMVNGTVVCTYREVESGKRSDRPELAKAIAHAKRIKGRLVIAKLDRLARNVAFIATVMESKVEFVACDNPHANKLTLHILAAMAEHEAEQISSRTKAALAAAKARGVLLGSARPNHWRGREHQREIGLVRACKAAKALRDSEATPIYSSIKPLAQGMRESGLSFRAIAAKLNDAGYTTVRGLAWNAMQVSRILTMTLQSAHVCTA